MNRHIIYSKDGEVTTEGTVVGVDDNFIYVTSPYQYEGDIPRVTSILPRSEWDYRDK